MGSPQELRNKLPNHRVQVWDEATSVMRADAPVSIVIPAYNEENGVAPVLRELLAELDASLSGIEIEVIVVDDGSKDATAEQAATVDDPRIRVVRHSRNRGYGAAIKTGVAQAKHDWILITDADGTYPNEYIAPILAERVENEMVVGARTGKTVKIPLIRRPAKWVLRRLAAYLVGVEIPDLNSGLRVMRKDIMRRYRSLLPDGFSLTTTITLSMFSGGQSVKYVPIDYRAREGSSKIRPIADTLNFLMLILRTVAYFEPLRVFLPLAVSFALGAAGLAGYGLYTSNVLDSTIAILLVTAVQMVGLGIVADMMSRRLRE